MWAQKGKRKLKNGCELNVRRMDVDIDIGRAWAKNGYDGKWIQMFGNNQYLIYLGIIRYQAGKEETFLWL